MGQDPGVARVWAEYLPAGCLSHLGPRFPVGAEGESCEFSWPETPASPSLPSANLIPLTSAGEGELFKMSIISLIILKFC